MFDGLEKRLCILGLLFELVGMVERSNVPLECLCRSSNQVSAVLKMHEKLYRAVGPAFERTIVRRFDGLDWTSAYPFSDQVEGMKAFH
jgi:hypothetical protein